MSHTAHKEKPKLPKGRPQGLLLRGEPEVVRRRGFNSRVSVVDRQVERAIRATERKARNSSLRSFNWPPPLKRQMSCNDHLWHLLKQIENVDSVWTRLARDNPSDIREINEYKFDRYHAEGGEIRQDCRQQRVAGQEGDVANIDELYAAAGAAERRFRALQGKLDSEVGDVKIENGNPN